MKREVVALACAIFTSTIAAPKQPVDTAPDLVMVTGVGQLSCGEFLEHKASGNSMQMFLYQQWIYGFMVAYNMRSNFAKTWRRLTSGNLSGMPDGPTILLFVESHCRAHPLDKVLDSTFALIADMGGEVLWKARK